MEMIVSQIASTQKQTQSAPNGQASKSAGGAEFQKTLVLQINGEAASGTGNKQGVQLAANGSKEAGSESDIAAAAPSLSDLMSVIDGLLEQLHVPSAEGNETPAVEDGQLKELEAVLDQMNALLALLGIPLPVSQQTPVSSTLENEGLTAHEAAVTAAQVKSNLQDTLLQLQSMVQQGTNKLIQQQEPTVLVAEKLQALTAILEGEPVDTNKSHTKSTAFTQQLFIAQNAPQAEVSTLLQRLSQKAVHPALLTTVAQYVEQTIEAEAVITPIEENPHVQPGINHSDSLRSQAPLAANAAAATSFVAAEEFAKSMTGMIVQKFDLTTLNGVSEAKIMLFPEHLGQVDVRITMQNGLLTAIFQTDTAIAKDMLDNQMAQLRSALQAQGLMVDKLEVSQGQSAALLSQQHQGQGSNQQQASGRQSFNGDEGAGEAQFETEIIEQAAIQGLGFGRGINVKA